MAEFSPVNCAEVAGSRSENFGGSSSSAKVTLRCRYDDRYALVNDLLENARPWPWSGDLYAHACGIKCDSAAMLNDGQAGYWEDALVDVSYDSKAGEDAFSEELAPTSEFLTADHRLFRWQSGEPLLEAEAPGYPMYGLEYKRTLYNQKTVPAAVISLPNHVNQMEHYATMLGVTFPAESMLFKPGSSTRKVMSNGSGMFKWTVNLAWSIKYYGWNVFWRPKTGRWERIYLAGTNKPYYLHQLTTFPSLLG